MVFRRSKIVGRKQDWWRDSAKIPMQVKLWTELSVIEPKYTPGGKKRQKLPFFSFFGKWPVPVVPQLHIVFQRSKTLQRHVSWTFPIDRSDIATQNLMFYSKKCKMSLGKRFEDKRTFLEFWKLFFPRKIEKSSLSLKWGPTIDPRVKNEHVFKIWDSVSGRNMLGFCHERVFWKLVNYKENNVQNHLEILFDRRRVHTCSMIYATSHNSTYIAIFIGTCWSHLDFPAISSALVWY